MSETLPKEDWLRLMDHLFIKSDEPELLLYFVSAYLLTCKQQLLQVNCVEDLAVFLATPATVNFSKVISLAE